jgi:hypothetical protein
MWGEVTYRMGGNCTEWKRAAKMTIIFIDATSFSTTCASVKFKLLYAERLTACHGSCQTLSIK